MRRLYRRFCEVRSCRCANQQDRQDKPGQDRTGKTVLVRKAAEDLRTGPDGSDSIGKSETRAVIAP